MDPTEYDLLVDEPARDEPTKIAATYHRATRDADEFTDEDVALFEYVHEHELARGPCYVDNPSAVRPAYEHMLADAAAGRFHVLAVYRFEYLCRTTRELDNLRAKLLGLGVEIELLTPAPATSTSRIGRPPREFDVIHARRLKGQGKTFKQIADALGVGVGTVHRALTEKPRPQLRA